MTRFYVYEHWRPDLDVCFWVGKGNGDRAYRFKRNFHYNNVVKKLARLGMCVEVRMVQSGLNELEAFAIEIARIAFWHGAGIRLTNYTAGGEGPSGYKHRRLTRKRIRAKRALQKIRHSEATKRKIGAANSVALKGRKNPGHALKMKGRKHTARHRENISAGLIGRAVSVETREKIARSNKGKKRRAETRDRLRLSHLGKRPTEETRRKMSEGQRARHARSRRGAECLP